MNCTSYVILIFTSVRVSENSPLLFIPVSSNQSGSSVDQDEVGAGDKVRNLQSSSPGEGVHVQYLHGPDHAELFGLRGRHAAHHHHLVTVVLPVLDAGVVHTSNVHTSQRLAVQLYNDKMIDSDMI